MRELFLVSVILGGIFVFAAQIQARSGNTSFQVSVHLPAAVSNFSDKTDDLSQHGIVMSGHPVDMFEEERMVSGERVIFKTRVLR